MTQEISLWQAVVLAALPAVVGVAGVVVTVVVTARQESMRLARDERARRDQREHERDLDWGRFMRQERRSEYARIIAESREAVVASGKALGSATFLGADHPLAALAMDEASRARRRWRTVWADAELVASDEIIDRLRDVDALLSDHEVILAEMIVAEQPPEDPFAGKGPVGGDSVGVIERLVETARGELGVLGSKRQRSSGDP